MNAADLHAQQVRSQISRRTETFAGRSCAPVLNQMGQADVTVRRDSRQKPTGNSRLRSLDPIQRRGQRLAADIDCILIVV